MSYLQYKIYQIINTGSETIFKELEIEGKENLFESQEHALAWIKENKSSLYFYSLSIQSYIYIEDEEAYEKKNWKMPGVWEG